MVKAVLGNFLQLINLCNDDYLEKEVGPHDMEALQDEEESIKYEVSWEHFGVPQCINNSRFQNPARKNYAPRNSCSSVEILIISCTTWR